MGRGRRITVALAFLVNLGVSALSGCHRSSPSEVATSGDTPRNQQLESTERVAEAKPAASVGDSRDPIAKGASDDASPTRDGWDSEAVAELVDVRLKEFGKLFLSDKLSAEVYRPFVTTTFTCDPLRPDNLLSVYRDQQLEVRRGAPVPDVADGLTPSREPAAATLSSANDNAQDDGVERLLAALRTLREPLINAPKSSESSPRQPGHYKFKVIDVDIQNPHFPITRQFFAFNGPTSGGWFEQNSQWRIVWKVADSPSGGTKNEVALQIASIQLESYEEVLHRSETPFLFSDRTLSVFAKEPSFDQQLRPGLAYWRKQLESFICYFQFGHEGIAVADVNNDGLEDIYYCQPGGLPNRLYLQQSDGTVRDAASESGLDFLDNTRSALFVDIDNDHDQDALLALQSFIVFLENDGKGKFVPRTRVRVPQAFSLTSSDFDLDGDLDFYACVYYGNSEEVTDLPLPLPYFDANNGGRNVLIRNDGNWEFSDATVATGLDENNRRFSFAAVWEDFNGDGFPDLYVANDFGRNNLYLFNKAEQKYHDVAADWNAEDAASGMSVSSEDFDHDGQMDVYVSNMFSSAGSRVMRQPRFKPGIDTAGKAKFQHLAWGNTLFRNADGGGFRDVSDDAGVTIGRWAWASLFVDVNNDSWGDLLVANGFMTGEDTGDL